MTTPEQPKVDEYAIETQLNALRMSSPFSVMMFEVLLEDWKRLKALESVIPTCNRATDRVLKELQAENSALREERQGCLDSKMIAWRDLETLQERFDNCDAKREIADYAALVAMGNLEEALREKAELQKNYNELIMAVERKFPNETRHQTAHRYIRQCESYSSEPAGETYQAKSDLPSTSNAKNKNG